MERDGKPYFPSRLGQDGGSMMQIMIALAMGGVLLLTLSQIFSASNDVKSLVRNADVLMELEQRVRQAAMSNWSIAITRARNKKINACFVAGETCPTAWTRFDLGLFKHDRASGGYEYSGGKCSSFCPIEVETRFSGSCTKNPCTVASVLHIEYRILIQGDLARKGVVSHTFKVPRTTDQNVSCGVDDLGRPKFAKTIANGSLSCLQVPKIKTKLEGVRAGTCVRAKGPQQVLVGFESSGELICEPAKFSK